MKCKAIGCCTHAYSSTGYCYRHLYLVKANRIVSKAGSIMFPVNTGINRFTNEPVKLTECFPCIYRDKPVMRQFT